MTSFQDKLAALPEMPKVPRKRKTIVGRDGFYTYQLLQNVALRARIALAIGLLDRSAYRLYELNDATLREALDYCGSLTAEINAFFAKLDSEGLTSK